MTVATALAGPAFPTTGVGHSGRTRATEHSEVWNWTSSSVAAYARNSIFVGMWNSSGQGAYSGVAYALIE